MTTGDGDGISRRKLLGAVGAAGATAGSYKAVDNVILGYGTNLTNQDIAPLAGDGLSVPTRYTVDADGATVSVSGLYVEVGGDGATDELFYPTASAEEAAAVDARHSLDGVVEEVVTDARRVRDGEYSFEFHAFGEFFERVEDAETRPYTTGLVRGFEGADEEAVTEFVGVSPDEPKDLLEGFESAFVDGTVYDIPRYVAGSITDNILFKTVRLRPFFEGDVGYEALNSDGSTGMFCYEYVYRSVEGLHSIPAHRQEVPVAGVGVHDSRHKHYYTGVATAVEEDGELVFPMTFVDYTRTTLYDDLHLAGVLGSSLNAYDSSHRATRVDWG